MKPISFPEQNTVFAKDQPQYHPLPAHVSIKGRVTSCWSLNWKERLSILLHGRLWLAQLTFHEPLQPQLPTVFKPEFDNSPIVYRTKGEDK